MRTALLAAVAAAFFCSAARSEDAPGLKAVSLRHGQILVSPGGKILTRDKPRKSLPVWSRNGKLIAFVEAADEDDALARLIVIDEAGAEVANIRVHPAAPDTPIYGGMRFVEKLEWLSDASIAVSGSLNPSSVEYIVFDIKTGEERYSFVDDCGCTAFSPDGQRYAYVDGAPHWSPRSKAKRELRLNGQPVYRLREKPDAGIETIQWSADSASYMAGVVNDAGRLQTVLFAAGGSRPKRLSIPAQAMTSDVSLFWDGSVPLLSRLAANGARTAVWRLSDTGAATTTATSMAEAPSREAKALFASARKRFDLTGARYVDLWCAGCVLDKVPRSTGVERD